jgi:peptidoglycan/LPS O-acetylase OafA/YrhL
MVAAGLCGTLALAGIAGGRGPIAAPLLASPPLRWLGTVSYSFYLWHPVVMATVKALMLKAGAPAMLGPWSQLVFGVVSLPGALVVALFSQRWLERDLTRWLRRQGPHEDRGRAPVTARTGPAPPELRP